MINSEYENDPDLIKGMVGKLFSDYKKWEINCKFKPYYEQLDNYVRGIIDYEKLREYVLKGIAHIPDDDFTRALKRKRISE